MNNDDLQVLEHAHILQQQANGHMRDAAATNASINESAERDHDAIVGGAAFAITMQNSRRKIEGLQSALDKLQNNRNDIVAVARASNATINALVQKLAEVTHNPVESVLYEANVIRSREYDAIADEWLDNGNLVSDSRQDPEVMRLREWYQP